MAEGALARGHEALAAGNWEDARDAFEDALAAGDSPEALDGLGRALWWLRDATMAIDDVTDQIADLLWSGFDLEAPAKTRRPRP